MPTGLGYSRKASMRRLQDNYSKLTPEQQRGMGYGTITKADKGKVNKAPAPAPAKAKATGKVTEPERLEERLKVEESEGMERGRGFGGLAGLKVATGTDTDASRMKNRKRK